MNLRELKESLAWDKAKGLYKGDLEVLPPSVTLPDGPLDPMGIVKKLERTIRVAYKSEDKITDDSWSKLISHILSLKHESTLEHVGVTFHITTNRGVTHELVRHRVGCAYTQESTRYCSYGQEKKGGKVIYPTWLVGKGEDQKAFWYTGLQGAFGNYNKALEFGWKPQEARGLLPNDLKTEIVWTGNLRSIRHFLGLRLPSSAHPDIRVIGQGVLEHVGVIPLVFDSFKEPHASPVD